MSKSLGNLNHSSLFLLSIIIISCGGIKTGGRKTDVSSQKNINQTQNSSNAELTETDELFLANCNEKNECEIVDERACKTEVCEDNLIDYALDNDSSELNYLFLANCDREQNCQIVPDTECSKIECRDNLIEYLLKRTNIEIPKTTSSGPSDISSSVSLRNVGERISFTYNPSRRDKAKEYMKNVKQNLEGSELKFLNTSKKLKALGKLKKLRQKKSIAAPVAIENLYSIRRIMFDKSQIDTFIDRCKEYGCKDINLEILGFANPETENNFTTRKISTRNISTRIHRTPEQCKELDTKEKCVKGWFEGNQDSNQCDGDEVFDSLWRELRFLGKPGHV